MKAFTKKLYNARLKSKKSRKNQNKSQDYTEADYTRAELTAQPPTQQINWHDSALSQVSENQQVSQTLVDIPGDIDLSQLPDSHQLTQTYA